MPDYCGTEFRFRYKPDFRELFELLGFPQYLELSNGGRMLSETAFMWTVRRLASTANVAEILAHNTQSGKMFGGEPTKWGRALTAAPRSPPERHEARVRRSFADVRQGGRRSSQQLRRRRHARHTCLWPGLGAAARHVRHLVVHRLQPVQDDARRFRPHSARSWRGAEVRPHAAGVLQRVCSMRGRLPCVRARHVVYQAHAR